MVFTGRCRLSVFMKRMKKVLNRVLSILACGLIAVGLGGCVVIDYLEGQDQKHGDVNQDVLATYFDGPKVRPGVALNISVTAAKEITVTDSFSIPVFAQVAANPYTREAFFVIGFTLQP